MSNQPAEFPEFQGFGAAVNYAGASLPPSCSLEIAFAGEAKWMAVKIKKSDNEYFSVEPNPEWNLGQLILYTVAAFEAFEHEQAQERA